MAELYKPCEGCAYSKEYINHKYDDYVCTHPQATSVGHSDLGKEQPVYVSQSIFYRMDCKGRMRVET